MIVGGETGGRWLAGNDRQLRALTLSPFVAQKLGTLICSENAADLHVLTELIQAGELIPVIDRTYSLNQTVEAIRYVQEGHARGKVVITMWRPNIGRVPIACRKRWALATRCCMR